MEEETGKASVRQRARRDEQRESERVRNREMLKVTEMEERRAGMDRQTHTLMNHTHGNTKGG